MSHVPSASSSIASQPLTHFLFSGGIWWMAFRKHKMADVFRKVSEIFSFGNWNSCIIAYFIPGVVFFFRGDFNPKGSEVKFQVIPVEMCA